MAALTTLCLPLLLVTLLPAGLAYSVFRTGSSRSGDARTDEAELLELCAILTCAHLSGIEHGTCVLQCMEAEGEEVRGHDIRRQLDNVHGCSQAVCPPPQDLNCIWEHCLRKYSPKMLVNRESGGPGGSYGFLKRGGTYGNIKDEKRAQKFQKVVRRVWGESYLLCLETECALWASQPNSVEYNKCAGTCTLTG